MIAPDFPTGLQWLNVDQPLEMAELRGKFVLLDFWTYCCINCIHVIPDLKRLEAKFPDELFVIGVHSGKFDNEHDQENIRQAILKYEIHHPVVNDPDNKVWNSYGVSGWPTVVLIDPNGKLIGKRAGEGVFKDIDMVLEELIPRYAGQLNRKPIELSLEADKVDSGLLSFPGKVLADESSQRLFIADSGNNRLIYR